MKQRQSLDVAGADEAWRSRIRAFWDTHFPVMHSVKTDYAYFAIEKDTHRVVHGLEPDYEDIGWKCLASGDEKLRAEI